MAHAKIETSNQDSLPRDESSLEPVYGISLSFKEAHLSDDLVPDEIYLMVAGWNTPTSEVGEEDSTHDCISAAASNINFEPIRRMLTSAHPLPPSKFLRSTKKSKTS